MASFTSHQREGPSSGFPEEGFDWVVGIVLLFFRLFNNAKINQASPLSPQAAYQPTQMKKQLSFHARVFNYASRQKQR